MARRRNDDYYRWMLASQGLANLGNTFGKLAEKQDTETQADLANYLMVGGEVPESLRKSLGPDFVDIPGVDISGTNPTVQADQAANVNPQGEIDPLARAQGLTGQQAPATDQAVNAMTDPMAQAEANPATQQKQPDMPYYDQYLTRYKRVMEKLPEDSRKKFAPKINPTLASMMAEKSQAETRKAERGEEQSWRKERATADDAYREKNFSADESYRDKSLELQYKQLQEQRRQHDREKVLDTKFASETDANGNEVTRVVSVVQLPNGSVSVKYGDPLPATMKIREPKTLEDQIANLKAMDMVDAKATKELEDNNKRIKEWAENKGIYGKDKNSTLLSQIATNPEQQQKILEEFNAEFGNSGYELKFGVNETKNAAGDKTYKQGYVHFPQTPEGLEKVRSKYLATAYEVLKDGRYQPKGAFYKNIKQADKNQQQGTSAQDVTAGVNPLAGNMLVDNAGAVNETPGLPDTSQQQLTPEQREAIKRRIIKAQQSKPVQ